MRTVSGIMLIALLTGFMAVAINVRQAASKPGTIIVPDDYLSIQDAINNASAGDTIFVRAGTYNCHIQIDKPLTLKGESSQNTTLRLQGLARPHDYTFIVGIYVIASNVTISGFHLIGPGVMIIMVDGRAVTADNCVIKDNVLEEYGTDALVLFSSHDDEVVGNVISSQDGSCIYLMSSSNCLLRNNSLSGSEWVGIMLGFSSNNTVSNNFITNQIDSLGGPGHAGAITIGTSSDDNTVFGNTLVNNDYGVTCSQYTQNNVIYHNNFVNNTHQTYDQLLVEQLPANFWDNGYPSGGNYWSDYNGNDSFSGPYQNVTGSDRIGDAPYVMDAVSSDRYPLMSPWKNPVGDVNMDGKVDGKDLGLAAQSFASYGPDYVYRGSAPSPRWNLDADINGDNKIDGKDLGTIAGNFGK
jgi:parallel beta-helix repeat protein